MNLTGGSGKAGPTGFTIGGDLYGGFPGGSITFDGEPFNDNGSYMHSEDQNIHETPDGTPPFMVGYVIEAINASFPDGITVDEGTGYGTGALE